MKLVKILYIVLVFRNVYSDCLSKEILEGLGFTGVKDAPEVLDQKICRGIFKSHGACVDPESVKALIEKKRTELEQSLDVEEVVDEVITEVAVAVDDSTITTEVNTIKDEFKESKGPCMKALDKVNMGVYCLLASGRGSEWASQNGTDIVVKIKDSTAETETEPCKKTFNAICLAANGAAPEDNIEIEATEVQSDNTEVKSGCGKLKEKGAKFLEKFPPGQMKDKMPKKEKLKDKVAKIKENKEKIKEKIKKNGKPPGGQQQAGDANQQQPARRLQDQYTVTIQTTSDGADVVAYGEDSGVSEMYITVVMTSLMTMIYVFM